MLSFAMCADVLTKPSGPDESPVLVCCAHGTATVLAMHQDRLVIGNRVFTEFTGCPHHLAALQHILLVCLQQYYTSGFLSVQSAVDAYVLGLSANNEATLGPFKATNSSHESVNTTVGALPNAQSAQLFNTWGATFPTPAWRYNMFYDAVGPMMGECRCCTSFKASNSTA